MKRATVMDESERMGAHVGSQERSPSHFGSSQCASTPRIGLAEQDGPLVAGPSRNGSHIATAANDRMVVFRIVSAMPRCSKTATAIPRRRNERVGASSMRGAARSSMATAIVPARRNPEPPSTLWSKRATGVWRKIEQLGGARVDVDKDELECDGDRCQTHLAAGRGCRK
eukprot:scaffold89045_cov32-Tisochrysis_lutea.AAC.10